MGARAAPGRHGGRSGHAARVTGVCVGVVGCECCSCGPVVSAGLAVLWSVRGGDDLVTLPVVCARTCTLVRVPLLLSLSLFQFKHNVSLPVPPVRIDAAVNSFNFYMTTKKIKYQIKPSTSSPFVFLFLS